MSSILVIDDDPSAVKLLERALTRVGHVVHVARDVSSGKGAARAGGHDLMILDVFLPDGSGLEVLRYLRADLGSATPVLLLTGSRQVGFQSKAEAAGADGYVTKPFSIQHLLGEVDRLTG